MNNNYELNENSPRILHPTNITITLKEHQLAMIQKCIDIEKENLCGCGIMNDKPGCGKSYAILGLINYTKNNYKVTSSNSYNQNSKIKKEFDINAFNNMFNSMNSLSYCSDNSLEENMLSNLSDLNNIPNDDQENNINIIVIPQNIVTQWKDYINNFSNELRYKVITEYGDIIKMYDDIYTISDYDIILTTSLLYDSVCTTINNNRFKIRRVFFDEIDSISGMLIHRVNTHFIWFVSASFNNKCLGIYGKLLNINTVDRVKCKCNNEFIESQFRIEKPLFYNIICHNIYVDNILNGLISKQDFILLNAYDYSQLFKKFSGRIANNLKEATSFIVKDINELIEYDEMHISDSKKEMEKIDLKNEMYNKYLNKEISIIEYITTLINCHEINLPKLIQIIPELQELSEVHEDYTNELFINDVTKILTDFFGIYNEELNKIFKDLNDYRTVIYSKIIENINKRSKTLEINKHKVKMINERLINNNCCPTCFDELENTPKKAITPCCQNIICYKCVEHWCKDNNKTNCIYCNKEGVKFSDYIVIKEKIGNSNFCSLCDDEFIISDETGGVDISLYSECCDKPCCHNCLSKWYNKLLKKNCPVCHKKGVLVSDFKTKNKEKEIFNDINNVNDVNDIYNYVKKNDIKHIKKSKIDFLENYIYSKIINNKINKTIIFSDYINSFINVKDILNKKNIKYTEFDGGNIEAIEQNLIDFRDGDAQVLMCNSLLFGCGMNLEFATDIIFFHKMTNEMKNQVIGRCQRPGRRSILNIWYLMHDNENEYNIDRSTSAFSENTYMNDRDDNIIEDATEEEANELISKYSFE